MSSLTKLRLQSWRLNSISGAIVVLIRRTGGDGERPRSAVTPDERALEEIVKRAPSLLPGGSDNLAVVDELSDPGVGFADLVAVGTDGRL